MVCQRVVSRQGKNRGPAQMQYMFAGLFPDSTPCAFVCGLNVRTHRIVVVVVEVNLSMVVDIERIVTVCRHIGEPSLVKTAGRRGQWKS